MRKVKIGFWILILLFIGTVVFFYLRFTYTNSAGLFFAEKGEYSLSDSDFESHSVFKLHGNIAFYNNKLLAPDDFKNDSIHHGFETLEIPGKWNSLKSDTTQTKGHGIGTYRFHINVPNTGPYGLKINEVKSAYSIWVNGEYLGGAGNVSKNKDQVVPSRLNKEFYFYSNTKHIEVIIQAANYQHYKGGITKSIIFGRSANIIDYKNVKIGVDVFLFGLLFILFIYHSALYTYRKNDKSILYFSILCLAMLLRLGYTGEKILFDIAHFIPWVVAIRIEYISFLAIPIFTILFMRQFFPKEVSRRLVIFISSTCAIFIFIVLFTSTTFSSHTPFIFLSTISIAATYLLLMVFIAILRKREYAIAAFIGYLVFFILSFNDLLFYRNIIDTANLMPIGLLVVTFSQAYVLAKKTATAYSKNEILSEELSYHANELENIVESRTKEIIRQKEEIELQKNKLQEHAEKLKASNDQLLSLANFKNDVTNMMLHDLKTPLSNIIGFTRLPGDIEKYKNVIHHSGWEMQNLIQNILDVEKYDETQLSINQNYYCLNDIVNKAYKNAYFMILNNNIRFENIIQKERKVFVDEGLLLRVFSNILSNATKHGNKNGLIEVSTKTITENGKDFCKVNIYNSGEPIPTDKLDSVFHKFVQLNQFNGINYSTGIGLTFCRLAIEAHGGEIGAISGKEKGVSFWFTLPL